MFQLKLQRNQKVFRAAQRSTPRKGSVLLIVCMAMPMIMGFCALAIDYGIMNVDANRLQRACDAAALAGAAKLKKTSDAADVVLARAEAITVASRNGVTITDANISFPSDTVAPVEWANWSRIRVEGTVTQPLLFTRLWKMYSTTMYRHATAESTTIAGLPGVVPLVITTTDYDNYISGAPLTLSLIRMQSKKDFDQGYVIGISTDPSNNGKSPSKWESNVKDGTDEVVKIDDNDVAINASLQNSSGRLDDALADRIADSKAAGWEPGVSITTAVATAYYPNYPGSAARRMFTIAVADPTAASTGNQNIVIKNFVRVYLVSAGNGKITIRLMPNTVLSSEGTYTTNKGSVSSGLSFVRTVDDLG